MSSSHHYLYNNHQYNITKKLVIRCMQRIITSIPVLILLSVKCHSFTRRITNNTAININMTVIINACSCFQLTMKYLVS